MDESVWEQRRVSMNRQTQWLPQSILVLSFTNLVWEVIKANLSEQARTTWPWRFTLLDAAVCAAMVTLLTGIVVTRTQLSLTLRPVINWSGFTGGSESVPNSARTVILRNAGGGRAIVRSVSYRIAPHHSPADHAAIPSGWVTWRAATEALTSLGLVEEQDFYLHHLGSGAALLMTSNSREGLELLALGPQALERLSALDVRVRVIDTLGDVYERDLQCIRPWWGPSTRP